MFLRALCAGGVQTLKVRRTLEGLKEQHHELEEDYQEAQEEAEAAEIKITAAHSRSAALCPCTASAPQSLDTIIEGLYTLCAPESSQNPQRKLNVRCPSHTHAGSEQRGCPARPQTWHDQQP